MKQYHVTGVLSAFSDFSRIPPEVLENAAARGTKVHGLCASYALGLYLANIPDDCAGFFDSFRRWYDVNITRQIMVEQRTTCHVYGITGQVDLVAEMNDGAITLIDHKTAALPLRVWRGQLSAYKYLAESQLGQRVDRVMSLQLKKDGSAAKANVYTDIDAAWAAYLSVLNGRRYFDED